DAGDHVGLKHEADDGIGLPLAQQPGGVPDDLRAGKSFAVDELDELDRVLAQLVAKRSRRKNREDAYLDAASRELGCDAHGLGLGPAKGETVADEDDGSGRGGSRLGRDDAHQYAPDRPGRTRTGAV